MLPGWRKRIYRFSLNQPAGMLFLTSPTHCVVVEGPPIVIILYEYFALLPDEVRFFWAKRGRLSITSILFFMNRYIWLVATPFAVATKLTPLHAKASLPPKSYPYQTD